MNPIICPGCGHSNEVSRVFCQNCGIRLPRPSAQVQEVAAKQQAGEKKAANLRRGAGRIQTKPKVSFQHLLASLVASVLKLAFLSALIAALILVFREPGDLPERVEANEELVEQGDRQLRSVLDSSKEETLSANEATINTYLATKVNVRGASVSGLAKVEVDRMFVQLGSGDFSLGVQYELVGLPMVVQTSFRPVPTENGYDLQIEGGSIGRLMLPSWIFERFVRWYSQIADALQPQLSVLGRASSVQIRPNQVTVTWKPASAATPSAPRQPDAEPSSDLRLRSPSPVSPSFRPESRDNE